MSQLSFDKLPHWVGKELGVSEWVTIGQQRIDDFAHCTEDHQWIHTDQQRAAAESPFGGTIAHGFLTAALLAKFSFEVFIKPAGIQRVMNIGIDKLRFLSPVKSGARIRGRIMLSELEEKGPGRFLLSTQHTIEIDGQAKPALTATSLVLVFEQA